MDAAEIVGKLRARLGVDDGHVPRKTWTDAEQIVREGLAKVQRQAFVAGWEERERHGPLAEKADARLISLGRYGGST